MSSTNLTVSRFGFLDVITTSESVDGAYLRLINGYLQGVVANNNSLSYTTTSNLVSPSTTQFYQLKVEILTDPTSVTFTQSSVDTSGVRTTNWTSTMTGVSLPSGAGRYTGMGVMSFFTGTSITELMRLDAMSHRNTRRLFR